MIEVKNLTKRFKKGVTAVDSINFKANDGEILGLLGENGAGKTTTLRMLATMLKITEGEALINGHDVNKEADKVRGEIGILFGGEVGLYDRLTARENIKYFAELNGMSKEETNKSIEELAKNLDMTEYLDRRVGKFSRGMKQKVAIARSIVHNPSVVLFDEPTIGLDVTSAKIVQDFILKCKSDGRTIIFSSHTIPEVEKLCDRIVIIHKGKIVEEGKLRELEEKYNNSIEEIFINLIAK
ncbi:ATP-binding cassette domain-containing protein [Clostridium botulinum]|uniref:Putative sodium extrusion ATP-binding protein NatA n=1 Tax=Clostridium botulinum (strain Okra / Type B1) TaxID=498213 RepID=B1IHF8_CLOBK|nr:ATP-binding cassette domain-containing protein [Clostridium botulinum]EKX79878.1 sodium extrusion ATP-binding protein NatA [Clostridium botulinum CFSAN001628]ACA43964.1 putative sodium extrusion ATP-binding protein NatA [Clostridium botulinum B1 str. Okra]MBD5563722.1 ATP-binding cassette domain-containing protein [Clostridium botulinum]MBD5566685.1 ATP-binding cassette domain-containing protein [Clostridium botulinum]MBD5568799.1 ATP-binding cassette domain-containing protein [Clostridium 